MADGVMCLGLDAHVFRSCSSLTAISVLFTWAFPPVLAMLAVLSVFIDFVWAGRQIMLWSLDPFTHRHLWLGGRLLSCISSCGWVVSFSAYPSIAGRSRARPLEASMGDDWWPFPMFC